MVDEFHKTHEEGIYAIGDVIDKSNLTPVAVRAGRFLAEYIFNKKNVKVDYECIPTVIFSHPPISYIGINL